MPRNEVYITVAVPAAQRAERRWRRNCVSESERRILSHPPPEEAIAMIRSSILATTVLSLTLAAACDNASSDAQKAEVAQTEANDKSAGAMKVADDAVKSAQAEADEKVAAAQADFLKLREDYRHKVTTNLVELDRKTADLTAKLDQLRGKERAELDASLRQIHAGRDAFARDYQSLEGDSARTWDNTKFRLDKEWADLKALVDKA
jgi:hypothetical protein